MLERGETPRPLGLWWVHAAALLLASAVLLLPRVVDALARQRAGRRADAPG
jgi:hypothetical protein